MSHNRFPEFDSSSFRGNRCFHLRSGRRSRHFNSYSEIEAMDFRLFNCDRTYDLDKVKALIVKVSPKANVKQHYFPLPRMSELCNELNEEGTFSGYAVFVVHAHESRLSLNEVNAGIGYAKLYRTLLKITDGRVLIVIGGDNNYKGQEQDDAFLSQWAWRKICSQFTEDFMDGTKSFIFSWDEEHRPIHEEALAFYLDPIRKTQGKFVPKPKPKATVVRHSTAGQKDATTDRLKSSNQHQPPEHGVKKSHPLDDKIGYATETERFPRENNKNRHLPPAPLPLEPSKQSEDVKRDDGMKPQLSGTSFMDVDKAPDSKTVQRRAFPMIHVVSILPKSDQKIDNILNNPVMNLLGDVFKSLFIPWGPHIPDIEPQDLPKHVQATSPDLVVLVSEYDDFNDVKNLDSQMKLFRKMLTSVKDEESTTLITVVTGDPSYKRDDLSSRDVEREVQNINGGILKHDKLKIMSWNASPNRTHRDVIENLLREYKPKERQLKTSELVSSEYDVKNGFLKCRAVIQDGRVLAILKSDPCDWSPSEKLLNDLKAKHRERTKVEFWENDSGVVTVTVTVGCISTAQPMLRKIAEISPTKQRHSAQVYSYHSDKRTFGIMDTFIKGLGTDAGGCNNSIELEGLLQDIVVKKTELVVFSCDMEIAKNIERPEDFPLDYMSHASRALGHLQWIVIVLTGDESCKDGDLASESALQILSSINQLLVTVGFPSETEKIAVMSWRDRPYIEHQNKLKNLLARSQSAHKKPAKETPIAGRTTRDPNPSSAHRQQPRKDAREVPLEEMTEPTFDPVHGYLRYRADLEYGRVVKVIERNPPDWQPDIRDLHFIAGQNMTVPNAQLEFWANSLDGPTKGPIVRTPKKSWVPSLPSLPKSWRPF